jgi:glutathione S-transferase
MRGPQRRYAFDMKLHWSPRSPFVRKVMVCVHETGLVGRIERVRSVVAMSNPNLELMRDNPLSKLPTLITDEGRVLFDSSVICEYLDTLHAGPRLFPASGAARWQALRRQALADGMLDTLVLWRNERDQPAVQQNAEWLCAFELKIRHCLDLIERETADLEQAPFGIGHVALGCALGYLDYRFADLGWRNGRARAAAWFGALSLRPSMRITAPVDDQ